MKPHSTGLDQSASKKITEALNLLLADAQVFYMNTRGLHWSIRGEYFFELHQKYETLYDDLAVKIDEIAERIISLGGNPYQTYSDYVRHAEIDEEKEISSPEKGVSIVLRSLTQLLVKEREIVQYAAESDDEGTRILVGNYIQQHEKLIWMYGAFYEGIYDQKMEAGNKRIKEPSLQQ